MLRTTLHKTPEPPCKRLPLQSIKSKPCTTQGPPPSQVSPAPLPTCTSFYPRVSQNVSPDQQHQQSPRNLIGNADSRARPSELGPSPWCFHQTPRGCWDSWRVRTVLYATSDSAIPASGLWHHCSLYLRVLPTSSAHVWCLLMSRSENILSTYLFSRLVSPFLTQWESKSHKNRARVLFASFSRRLPGVEDPVSTCRG